MNVDQTSAREARQPELRTDNCSPSTGYRSFHAQELLPLIHHSSFIIHNSKGYRFFSPIRVDSRFCCVNIVQICRHTVKGNRDKLRLIRFSRTSLLPARPRRAQEVFRFAPIAGHRRTARGHRASQGQERRRFREMSKRALSVLCGGALGPETGSVAFRSKNIVPGKRGRDRAQAEKDLLDGVWRVQIARRRRPLASGWVPKRDMSRLGSLLPSFRSRKPPESPVQG